MASARGLMAGSKRPVASILGAGPNATSATTARVAGSITVTESASGLTTQSARSSRVSAIVDEAVGPEPELPLHPTAATTKESVRRCFMATAVGYSAEDGGRGAICRGGDRGKTRGRA